MKAGHDTLLATWKYWMRARRCWIFRFLLNIKASMSQKVFDIRDIGTWERWFIVLNKYRLFRVEFLHKQQGLWSLFSETIRLNLQSHVVPVRWGKQYKVNVGSQRVKFNEARESFGWRHKEWLAQLLATRSPSGWKDVYRSSRIWR